MGFNGFYWVLLGFTRLLWFRSGYNWDLQVLFCGWRTSGLADPSAAASSISDARRRIPQTVPSFLATLLHLISFFCFYRVLLGFYRVEPGRKRFDCVFQGCSLSTSVLLGFTEFFWVFMVFLYGIDLCGMSLTFGAVWLGNSGKELELEIVRCQCVRTWKSRERLGQSKVR